MAKKKDLSEMKVLTLKQVVVAALAFGASFFALLAFVANFFLNALEGIQKDSVDTLAALHSLEVKISSNVIKNNGLIALNKQAVEGINLANKASLEVLDARLAGLEGHLEALRQLATQIQPSDESSFWVGLPLDERSENIYAMGGDGPEFAEGFTELTHEESFDSLKEIADFLHSNKYQELSDSWRRKARTFWQVSVTPQLNDTLHDILITPRAEFRKGENKYYLRLTARVVEK